ncbi:MAG: hypothetical protein M5U01_16365 [Ardenticatenaceae bacterium]|nr:hypothetical protein [Ardenticatenaceae bacterium]HBY97549.1 hypothetical protein [Chloroflexota bacterium]
MTVKLSHTSHAIVGVAGTLLVLLLLSACSSSRDRDTPSLQDASAATMAGVLAPASDVSAATLRRLTADGCCPHPFWSADSQHVLFIDKPSAEAPVGIWDLDTTRPGGPAELVSQGVAFYTPDMAFRMVPQGDTTRLERLSDGQHWTVPAQGRPVFVAPDQKHIAWQVRNEAQATEERTTPIWVANLDGSQPRRIAQVPRGNLYGWLSHDRLLWRGRDSLNAPEDALYNYSLATGTVETLARGAWIEGVLPSPGGSWIVYYVTRDKVSERNGLWLLRTASATSYRVVDTLFGAYQWRDDSHLLLIPLDPTAPSHQLWELDTQSLQSHRLTDPQTTPFKIADNDWSVSPDGRSVVFVGSEDHNLWLLSLPEEPGSQ